MIARLIRGARYSEEYGSHPGTAFLVVMTAFGAIAGADRGVIGACAGAGLMLLCYGPLWLIGCWSRG